MSTAGDIIGEQMTGMRCRNEELAKSMGAVKANALQIRHVLKVYSPSLPAGDFVVNSATYHELVALTERILDEVK